VALKTISAPSVITGRGVLQSVYLNQIERFVLGSFRNSIVAKSEFGKEIDIVLCNNTVS